MVFDSCSSVQSMALHLFWSECVNKTRHTSNNCNRLLFQSGLIGTGSWFAFFTLSKIILKRSFFVSFFPTLAGVWQADMSVIKLKWKPVQFGNKLDVRYFAQQSKHIDSIQEDLMLCIKCCPLSFVSRFVSPTPLVKHILYNVKCRCRSIV